MGGKGIPEGETVYVLRQNTKKREEFEIWNALLGECYYFEKETSHPFSIMGFSLGKPIKTTKTDNTQKICPLYQVDCIIGQEGIWLNNQKVSDPKVVSFDLNNKQMFKRLLHQKNLKHLKDGIY